MGLSEISYGHTLIQQVMGHCCDSQTSALIPLVLAAFIYLPPLGSLWNFIYAPFFNSEPGKKSTTLCLLGGNRWWFSQKTPQRRQRNEINKKRGDMERETDRRRNKEKRAWGQMKWWEWAAQRQTKKEEERRWDLRWSGGTHASLSLLARSLLCCSIR